MLIQYTYRLVRHKLIVAISSLMMAKRTMFKDYKKQEN